MPEPHRPAASVHSDFYLSEDDVAGLAAALRDECSGVEIVPRLPQKMRFSLATIPVSIVLHATTAAADTAAGVVTTALVERIARRVRSWIAGGQGDRDRSFGDAVVEVRIYGPDDRVLKVVRIDDPVR